MQEEINDMDGLLPTRDFFDFESYGLAPYCEYEGEKLEAKWAILSLPLQEGNREMLSKMLGALGVSMETGAVLAEVEGSAQVSLSSEWQALPNVQCWLIFGRSAQALGWLFDAPLYQVLRPHGRAVIFADALSVLQGDVAKKKLLWLALQQAQQG